MCKILFVILFIFFNVQAQVVHLDEFDLHSVELDNDANKIIKDQAKFEKFKETYRKTYQTLREEEFKFKVFRKNLVKIELYKSLDPDAEYDVNEFADLTGEEFIMHHTGLNGEKYNSRYFEKPEYNENLILPKEFDWRNKSAVTPVKNQGFCGSCWAFSTIGNIEGVNKFANGKLISLSEEELVDCDKLDNGCGGGLMTNAYKSIIKLGGLESETDYPYKPYFNTTCVFNKTLAKVKIDAFTILPKNETAIAQYLVEHGPVSIGINANTMQFYKGGISKPFKLLCNSKKLDHGVLLVGFGEKIHRGKNVPYWIIKNSWGKSWGVHGYYLLYRGANTCGVAEMASSAIIYKKNNQLQSFKSKPSN